jgi:hypothetical protein
MSIRTNKDRALRAKATVADYDENDICTNMYDLICDLHHLADLESQDWNYIMEMAMMHYEAEVAEEKGDTDG